MQNNLSSILPIHQFLAFFLSPPFVANTHTHTRNLIRTIRGDRTPTHLLQVSGVETGPIGIWELHRHLAEIAKYVIKKISLSCLMEFEYVLSSKTFSFLSVLFRFLKKNMLGAPLTPSFYAQIAQRKVCNIFFSE